MPERLRGFMTMRYINPRYPYVTVTFKTFNKMFDKDEDAVHRPTLIRSDCHRIQQ